MGSANILLSYRRADVSGMAGRIFDRLSQHYGPNRVFIDIDSIPMGVDFQDHLEAALADCGVLLALIGPKWIGRRPGKPARIHDEDDWVRVEVENAMGFGIPVIPVLLDGAALPKKELLPPSLHPMLRRNGVAIDAGKDFHGHVNRLIEGINALLGTSARADAPTATFAAAAVEAPKSRSRAWPWVAVAGAATGLVSLAVMTQLTGPSAPAEVETIEAAASPVASTESEAIAKNPPEAAVTDFAPSGPLPLPKQTIPPSEQGSQTQPPPAQLAASRAQAVASSAESAEQLEARWFATVNGGEVAKIRAMLDSGLVTINTLVVTKEANTALHLAAERCNNDVVRFLLARGADPLRKNVYKDSALRIAQAPINCGPDSTTAQILNAEVSR